MLLDDPEPLIIGEYLPLQAISRRPGVVLDPVEILPHMIAMSAKPKLDDHGEGRNRGAHDVLVEAARAVGLDAARAKAILDGDEFGAEVRERERFWQRQGVGGVPFVVIDDKYAIEGAQSPEAFEQGLRTALASRPG